MNKNNLWPPSQFELIKISGHIKDVYTAEVNGIKLPYTELLKIFIKFMENSVYEKLIASEVVPERDFRHSMFNRIEIALVTYFHTVKQTVKNHIEIINDTIELGYTPKFGLHLAGNEREVQLRVAFLDRFFYNIDHFIQNMNKEFAFASSSNTKSKQQVFSEMLAHFGLKDAYFTPKGIFDLIFMESNSTNVDFLEQLRNNSDRKMKYSDLYEYVANMRNSLHNNGFSNKTLNNFSVGQLRYEMKKDEFIKCLSLPHLLVLLIPLTKVLTEIVSTSIEKVPRPLSDPFGEEVQAFLDNLK